MSEQQAPIHIYQIVDEAIEQGKQMNELVGLLVERGLEPHAVEKVILSRIQIRADVESRQPRPKRSTDNEPAFYPLLRRKSNRSLHKLILFGIGVLLTILIWWVTEDFASVIAATLGLITIGILNLFTDFRGGWWD